MYSWAPNRRWPRKLIFWFFPQSIFLFQPPSAPPPPHHASYWGKKFPTQTKVLKQYTCVDFFAISQKEPPVCSVFCFVSLCKKANTFIFCLEVSIEANLLPIIDLILQKQSCLLMFLLNVLLDLTDELDLFCWLFEFFIVNILFL